MNIESLIYEYVNELAEEAQAQIQTNVTDIDSVECACTEDDYVKLAVEATLLKDPVEALNAALEAHSWVMAREYAKDQSDYNVFDMNAGMKLWERAMGIVKRDQNVKLIKMITGETNG